MKRILNRYIFKEILLVFVFILLILTFVLLMGRTVSLMDLIINKGVRFLDVALLILFLLPSLMVYTIPISLLIATLIGIGRLSSDSEITVMKSSGISLYQLLSPVFILALISFLATAGMSLFLSPAGNMATKDLLFAIAQHKASVGIQERVFNDDFQGILIYANHIPPSGDYLEGVIVSNRRDADNPNTIFAQRAYLISDTANLSMIMRLETGISCSDDVVLGRYKQMAFRTYDVNLQIGTSADAVRQKGHRDMYPAELWKNIKKGDADKRTQMELVIAFYSKIAISFSCLIFPIIALPLAIRPQRSAKSRGFVVGIIIILLYYFLQFGSNSLVEMGKLPPLIGAVGPTVIFLASGLFLFVHAAREKSIALGKIVGRKRGG
ncbi:MAG: LPS export ABC transporter permease LptF [Syntrophobacterales bacterium]|jgi:lipopolysaccharide export system permease protein|nr:LPS export ABC transporter permease LptF [Syntrophobacterales bacterium]